PARRPAVRRRLHGRHGPGAGGSRPARGTGRRRSASAPTSPDTRVRRPRAVALPGPQGRPMPPPAPQPSLVCPAYEEEEVLPAFHAELRAALDPLQPEHEIEILYVDDGSRDGTLAVLRRLAAADARVRYLSLSRNFGHQAALTAGLEHTTGDVVV